LTTRASGWMTVCLRSDAAGVQSTRVAERAYCFQIHMRVRDAGEMVFIDPSWNTDQGV